MIDKGRYAEIKVSLLIDSKKILHGRKIEGDIWLRRLLGLFSGGRGD
jgi:hypothetical protein